MDDGMGTVRSTRRLGRMRRSTALSLAFVTALVVGACSGSASPAPTGAAPSGSSPTNGVEGRTFLSTAVAGRVLVAGSRIRLTFRDGQIGASAGCNSMGGPYRIEGGRLRAPQLATTDMGCDQALMVQDQWVADLLDGASLTLDGNTLTLTRNGVAVTFLDRIVADPDRPLTGTRWIVGGILTAGTASSVPAGATASVVFRDGRVDVETGCNTGSATATVAGAAITFRDLVLTKRACAPAVAALEMAVVATLSGTATFLIEADALTLTAGQHGLTLRALP